MKKVKTLVTTMLIVLASIFASACSCGGSDPDVTHTYEQDINIRCVTDNDNVTSSIDEVSGELTIWCHVDDRFIIEYEITPLDATTTQVNWAFDENTKGLVEPFRLDYTRNKSTVEQVEFVAKARSDTKYQTTLTFTTQALSKQARCIIYVYEAVEDLPTFAEVEGLKYDNVNNVLSWNRMDKVYTPDDDLVNADKIGSIAVGLTGYEVVSLDPATGEEISSELVSNNTTTYSKIESGREYNFKVRAIGDGLNVISGQFGDVYRFYKLNQPTGIANNDGTLNFTTPAKSKDTLIYYYGVENTTNPLTKTTTENTSLDVHYTEFLDYLTNSKYEISLISRPNGYNAVNGYAVVGTDKPVYYFPSTPTTNLVVQRLENPVVNLYDSKSPLTINDVTFGSGNVATQPHASTMLEAKVSTVYDTKYGAKFSYAIYKDGTITKVRDGESANGYINLEGLETGAYYAKLKTIGNASNTITSGETKISFNIMPHLTTDNVRLEDDKIITNLPYVAGGIELFFVSSSSSYYTEIGADESCEYMVDEIGLPAGTYKVYAKSVCLVSQNVRNASITPTSFTELFEIEIAPSVVSNKITSEGNILFKKLSDYDTYEVIIGRRPVGAIEYTYRSVEIYYPSTSNTTNGLLTYTYNADGLDTYGHTASIDIADVASTYLDGEDPNLYFSSSYEFTYQIVTVGTDGSVSGDNIISSSPTTAVEVQRYSGISNVSLDNYIVTFDRVGTSNSQQYKIWLNVYETNDQVTTLKNKYEFKNFIGQVNFDNMVEVDLRTLTTMDGTKTFAELIDVNADNALSISSYGYDGMVNSPAVLNSLPIEVTYEVTNTPTNVILNEEGVLSWTTATPSEFLAEYTYTINFYKATVEGETIGYIPLSSDTISNIAPVITDAGEGLLSISLSENIGDVLAKYVDQVIAITVTENKYDMYNGDASEYVYATRISSPVLTRVTTGSKDTISWNAIPNADVYDVEVTMLENSEFSYSSIGQGETTFSITDNLNSVGTYTITVSARSNDLGSSTITNPYVISSMASSTTIYIVSGSLDIIVNGNMLSWNNICAGTDKEANYTIEYTLSDNTTNTIDLDNALSYDATHFLAGTSSVTITPTISFEDSAFVIIGSPKTNSVEKWAVATGLTSTSGNLVFNVYGATDAEGMVVELYQTIDSTDTIVSTSNYSFTTEPVTDGDDTYLRFTVVLDGMNAGELTFKVKVKSSGKLDSDLSAGYTGIKINAVTDLEKSGEWLVWSAQDGISSYVLSYTVADTTSNVTLKVHQEDDGSYTAYTTTVVEGVETDGTDASVFKYVDGKFYYAFNHTLFVGDNIGDILFTIRPLTEESGYFSGNTSSIVTITKLNANSQITVVDGKINIANYEAVGSATPSQYTITIYELITQTVTDENGTSETVVQGDSWTTTSAYTISADGLNIAPIDLNTIGFPETGNYEIYVTFIGDGNNVITSKTIEKKDLSKLDTSSLFTQKGEIAWGAVEGASDYTIEVSDGTSTYNFVISGTTLAGQQLTYGEEDPVTPEEGEEGTEGEEIAPAAIQTFVFQSGIQYSVRVKANANGKLHSKWSNPFYVKKLYAPSDVVITSNQGKLEIEVPVEVDDGNGTIITIYETREIEIGAPIVTWADSNVTPLEFDYEIKYTDDLLFNILHSEQLSYPLDKSLDVADYQLQLRVFGNTSAGGDNIGYLTSDYSTAITVRYVADVNSPTVSNGVLNWSHINGAYSYKITAYTSSEYATYLAGGTLPTAVFERYSATNSFDTSSLALAELNTYSGSFTFVVNAITEPRYSIVSESAEKTNTTNIFKPNVLSEYKVKNGMLNWKVNISEVVDFVTGQMTYEDGNITGTNLSVDESVDKTKINDVARFVVDYAVRKITLGNANNATLDAQINHLISVNLDINGVRLSDTPTNAEVYDYSGNKILVDSGYITNGKYIEFSYDVSIEPEIDNNIVKPSEPENAGSETPDINAQTLATATGTNTAGVEYTAGRYTIKLAASGNSDTTVSVLNGGYTNEITAYKPNTPKTWTTGGADIYQGQIQWELSSTEQSTIDNFVYYKDYRLTATPVSSDGEAYIDVSVDDTYDVGTDTNSNLDNNYKYYRNLTDLFTTTRTAPTDTNVIMYNTNYRVLINTIGTEDSTLVATGDPIYLNSNSCVVSNVANILNVTPNVKIENSVLSWQTSYGSTATKLYIYGPFNVKNADGSAINENWALQNVSEAILTKIDDVYNEKYDITEEDIEKYSGMLQILTFAEEEGIRTSNFTMTNNDMFPAGGYIIRTQELGDNKGIVDSVISESYEAIKLEEVTMAGSSWVGVTDSNIYVWDSENDAWVVKTYKEGSPNQKVGIFVWNPVVGANTYRVEIFYTVGDSGLAYQLGNPIYTRETCYDMPDGLDYNNPEYKYFIRITACRTETNNKEQLSNNYFSSDFVDTSSHYRLAVPTNLTIYGTGEIKWNDGITYTDIGSYRVQFNYGEDNNSTEIISESENESVVPVLNLGAGNQDGTIAISVKAVIVSGNGFLNSGYCTPVIVTRLADPDMRLIDGTLYWGSNGDPDTATELTIDNETQIIGFVDGAVTYDTFYKYYTEIDTHNERYKATNDQRLFPVGEHTFTAMFQGTGGEDGYTMTGGEDYYIASNAKSLTATKLSAPEISNVALDLANVSENAVKWVVDTNAVGYRVRVFSNVAIGYEQADISLVDLLTTKTTEEDINGFIVINESGVDYAYFKLNDIISDFNLEGMGGEIYIYVQALGSGMGGFEDDGVTENDNVARTGDLYLSSSYSTYTAIGVPPQPTSLSYDKSNGELSWKVESSTAYNIKIETNYQVSNVTADELNNYWKVSSDKVTGINNADLTVAKTYIPYEEIVHREVILISQSGDTYTISVRDIIYLTASDNGGVTPTSYILTTVGTGYSFAVTAMSFVGEEDKFASEPTYLELSSVFQLFAGGDGSEKYPYEITDYAQLQTISSFMDRAFVINNTIEASDAQGNQLTWTPIKGEFTGTLDGQGNALSGFAMTSTLNSSGSNAIIALVETNSGTIKNIVINLADTGMTYKDNTIGINAGVIAITNNGTIDNVTVSGIIEITPAGTISSGIATSVGGIVVDNYGTISNVHVNATMTVLDDSENLASAGGIARRNYGTIESSDFAGSIKSNRIGGITGTNYGTINKCFVDNATIIATNESATSSTIYKGAQVGGIAGAISVGSNGDVARIINSYSKATIIVNKGADSTTGHTYTVGGLVASASYNQDIYIANCYVATNITKGTVNGSSAINIYHMLESNDLVAGENLVDNYYIIVDCDFESVSSRNDEGCTLVTTLSGLIAKLSNLEYDSSLVYNTTDPSSYPTLN